MSSSDKSQHILVFPFPAQGHMLPILDLVHQLIINGLTITILITPKNLPSLAPLLSSHPSVQTLIFPFPHHPSIPNGVENVKEMGNLGYSVIISALSQLHDQIVAWFISHPTPPIAIISDFFLGWTQDLATQIGIPRICFYSSGAFFSSLFYHIWKDFDFLRTLDEVKFLDLPRSPSFSMEQLPSVFRRYKELDPDWEVVKSGMLANNFSWGSILNTFDALEGEYLEYLKKIMGHHRVYGVGPLNSIKGLRRSDPSSGDGIMSWLDGCEAGSVLYVCFGSQKILKQSQIDALANGLDESGLKFIWVVKPVSTTELENGYGSVRDEFEARVSGRGLVIKGWAPQVSILNHPSVGGFLSHCGWNSVLEAIVAGVMILGWPMEADQFINARQLVDNMGVAVRVCEGGDTVPNSIELARIISKEMKDDNIKKVRTNELKVNSLKTIENGGSSTCDLEDFVKEIDKLQPKDIK